MGLYAGLMRSAPDTPEPPTLAVVGGGVDAAAAPALGQSSLRTIAKLRIADVVPKEGKFIGANLRTMEVTLYQDSAVVGRYPIKSKGRAGTPWETPSGFYTIRTKEEVHFSTIGKVYMPYSMQFYGNYFIHGWTYYADGTPTSATFSGGCIKLATEDAKAVYEFADIGTRVFVEDFAEVQHPPLVLQETPTPPVGAAAYVVADVDTGEVFAEARAQEPFSVYAATKLLTALVANETISFDKEIPLAEGELTNPPEIWRVSQRQFAVGDLLYPLLMQNNDRIAEAIAAYYGPRGFVRWMNTTAKALNMTSSTFVDATGASADNISTPEDLFRLAAYLATKKSFVLSITDLSQKAIEATDGTTYTIENRDAGTNDPALAVVTLNVGQSQRRVAIVTLGSMQSAQDVSELSNWITKVAVGEASAQTACAACSTPPRRVIEL